MSTLADAKLPSLKDKHLAQEKALKEIPKEELKVEESKRPRKK